MPEKRDLFLKRPGAGEHPVRPPVADAVGFENAGAQPIEKLIHDGLEAAVAAGFDLDSQRLAFRLRHVRYGRPAGRKRFEPWVVNARMIECRQTARVGSGKANQAGDGLGGSHFRKDFDLCGCAAKSGTLQEMRREFVIPVRRADGCQIVLPHGRSRCQCHIVLDKILTRTALRCHSHRMEDRVIRPSMKTVYPAYALALLVIVACIWAYFTYADDRPRWLLAIPFLVLLSPLQMQFRRRLITLRLHDDHLTLETGFASRTRRTVDMAKIQDVTVRQSLGQRMLGVGDLMLESAGESGRISLQNFDRPREIADGIIESSKRSHGAGPRTGGPGGNGVEEPERPTACPLSGSDRDVVSRCRSVGSAGLREIDWAVEADD